MIKKFTFTEEAKTIFFLASLWSMLWFSINSESSFGNGGIGYYIHKTRFYFPYAAAMISIGWMLHLGNKPNVKSWQVGMFSYAATVVFSGLWHDIEPIVLHFHAAILCTVIITILGSTIPKETGKIGEAEVIKIFATTGIIILTSVLVIFFLRDVIHAIILGYVNGYFVHGEAPHQFGMAAPRATGQARTASIVLIVCVTLSGFAKYRGKLFYYLGTFCLALIFFYQARGSILALMITFPVVLLCLPRSAMPQPVKIIKFLTIAVILFCAIMVFILAGIYAKAIIEEYLASSGPMSTLELKHSIMPFRYAPADFSSGRIENWKLAMDLIGTSPYIGLGGQADRLYIGQNVSNLLLYALLSGGLLAVTFAAMSLFTALKNVWFSIFKKPADHQDQCDYPKLCAIAIFVFLSTRGMVENSYSLFNIDFLLAVPAIWYLSFVSNKRKSVSTK